MPYWVRWKGRHKAFSGVALKGDCGNVRVDASAQPEVHKAALTRDYGLPAARHSEV